MKPYEVWVRVEIRARVPGSEMTTLPTAEEPITEMLGVDSLERAKHLTAEVQEAFRRLALENPSSVSAELAIQTRGEWTRDTLRGFIKQARAPGVIDDEFEESLLLGILRK